jgi:hypothetical protein
MSCTSAGVEEVGNERWEDARRMGRQKDWILRKR